MGRSAAINRRPDGEQCWDVSRLGDWPRFCCVSAAHGLIQEQVEYAFRGSYGGTNLLPDPSRTTIIPALGRPEAGKPARRNSSLRRCSPRFRGGPDCRVVGVGAQLGDLCPVRVTVESYRPAGLRCVCSVGAQESARRIGETILRLTHGAPRLDESRSE